MTMTGQHPRGRSRAGITVTGFGSAAAAVDQVTLQIGVVETRDDAGEAFQAASQTATQVLAVLADDGADARMVRTTDLTLGPRTEWDGTRETVTGYQAAQRLQVTLSALSGVERMLSHVAGTGGGSVRIDSVRLTPTDPDLALRAARVAATADARSRAGQLAALVGRELGEVVWIEEVPDQVGMGRVTLTAGRSGGSDLPLATGDATVAVAVTAHWRLAGLVQPND